MIYGYIRVSTDKQDCENQKLGIDAKASALGLCIDKYIINTLKMLAFQEPKSQNNVPWAECCDI